MNLKELREMEGAIVIFRPRPKMNGNLVREAYNSWIIVTEVSDRNFLFKNTTTNHEVILGADNIDQFRSSSFLLLRGQLSLKEGGGTEFEPFTPGLSDRPSMDDLVDETSRLPGSSLYEALKPNEGKVVTLRFPDKKDWKFGNDAAILEEVTPNYVTLRRPEAQNTVELPWNLPDRTVTYHVPEKTTSVPLAFVSLAEDVEQKRLMIVFDHSFWRDSMFEE